MAMVQLMKEMSKDKMEVQTMNNGLIYPTYNTKTFTEIYPELTDFTSDYATINLGGITDTNLLNKVYYGTDQSKGATTNGRIRHPKEKDVRF